MARPRAPAAVAGLSALALAPLAGPALAQHRHAVDDDVALAVEEAGPGALVLRLGPLELPAGADHHEVAQPPDRIWEVSFDGWILSYAPRLVGADGEPAPGRLLHHVAFWNTGRSDFLCPEKEEHIFGAGGEMNEWIPLPGVGYRVRRGDRIRVSAMFHNPTPADHREAYLEVRVSYQPEGSGEAPRSNVYPTWFDAQECGASEYDLEPGTQVTIGELRVPVAGRLLGVGGHLHAHGKELVLEQVGQRRGTHAGAAGGDTGVRPIARLVPETDDAGRILSMPVVPFLATGGRAFDPGDVVRVTARYENPTGRPIAEGAMGIVVGYFLPDDDVEMARFRRDGG